MLGVSWGMTCQAVKTSSCSWSVGCVQGRGGLGRARLVDFGAIGLLGGSAGPGHGLYAGCAEGDPGGRRLDAQQFLGGGLHYVGEIKCCVGSRSAQQAQASDTQGSSCGLGEPPAVRGQSRIKGARRPWGQRRHERVVTGRGGGHSRGEGPPGYQRVRVRRKSHGPPRGGGGSPASPVLEVLEEVLERRETWARRESVGGVDDASWSLP